jgi:hypothetical protein
MRLALLLFPLLLVGCSGRTGLSQPPDKQEIEAARQKGSPVAFSTTMGLRNSANGIDVMMTWENLSPDKTIKYAWFEVEFVNNVGDVVASEMPGRPDVTRLQATGPIAPGGRSWGGVEGWPAAFYHPNASSLRMITVSVEYTDGTKVGPIDVRGLPGSSGEIEAKQSFDH